MRQMAPDLLLHPVFDEAEALAGMPHREVVHPAPEHRIDQVYQPFNRLRPVSAEHLFERPHQRRPLFELGRVMRPHRSAQTAEEAELKAQEPEALTALKVHCAALFIIDFHLQLAELLPKPLVHRPDQPVMSLVGVDQDHQIVSEPRVFDVGVLAISHDLPRLLQHLIHLIEVEVAEQGRDDAALWNARLARSLQHNLQKMHDVRVVYPLRHFRQQPVVPDIVKVGAQINVEDPRLPLDYRLSNSLDRFMSSPLGTISKRSRLEIRLDDRLEYELERALHHSVADRRNREDADFAPVLRYLLPPRGKWLAGAPDQFVPQLLEQSLRALRLDGLEGDPVYSRCPIVQFGHLIRSAHPLVFGRL